MLEFWDEFPTVEQSAYAFASAFTTFKAKRRVHIETDHVDPDGAAMLMHAGGGTMNNLDRLPNWVKSGLEDYTKQHQEKPN